MNPPVFFYDAARAAGHILRAVQAGSLAALESELDRSVAWPAPAGLAADAAERWELLDAVARRMRVMLERTRQRLAECFQPAEVHLGLLEHLARAPGRVGNPPLLEQFEDRSEFSAELLPGCWRKRE